MKIAYKFVYTLERIQGVVGPRVQAKCYKNECFGKSPINLTDHQLIFLLTPVFWLLTHVFISLSAQQLNSLTSKYRIYEIRAKSTLE
jgi:hypothetical protein